jgi:hypothetical protein
MLFMTLPAAADPPSTLGDKYDAYIAQQALAEKIAMVEADKDAFAIGLAGKWEAEALERGNDENWLERISGVLSEEDAEALLSKSEAESWDDFIGVQTTSELVFYPLKPCRVVDTRLATRWGPYGTPVSSGQTIPVRTYPSMAGQGGASDCGVYSGAAAVVINVTAVPVSGTGHLRVWPYGTSIPNASLVNYKTGVQNVANAVVQSQCRGCSNELNVFSSATSHVIIDVIGYFAQNTRTAVDNYVSYSSQSVANNTSFNVLSPACPTGFRLTGGGFLESSYDEGLNFIGSRPIKGTSYGLISGTNQADRYLCQGRNQSGGTRTVYCHSLCARIPGR